MKKEIISVLPCGHGHYMVKFMFRNNERSSIITDMSLIDAYKSDNRTMADEKRLLEAAIWRMKSRAERMRGEY